MKANTISAEQYQVLRAKLEAFEGWRAGRTSYHPSEIPAHIPEVTNEQRSQMEVYEFVNNPPQRYFLYVRRPNPLSDVIQVTTWMGDVLGTGILGRRYKTPAFGGYPSTRYPIRFAAINGKKYFGTYYDSSGSYARVKMCK